MRTTITIPDKVACETMRISGKKRLTEAVVFSLQDYLSLKKRLALLDVLFEEAVPHNKNALKADRRRRKWSS